MFHNDYSPLILPEPWGIFLGSSGENLVGFPEVNPTKVWDSPKTVTCWSFSFSRWSTQPSAICQNYCLSVFYQFIASVASAPGRQILAVTLDLPVSPDFWVAICPATSVLCDPSSHCFSVYSAFYCRKDMSNDFQALSMSELKLEVMHVVLNPEIHNMDETWKKLLKNKTYIKKWGNIL